MRLKVLVVTVPLLLFGSIALITGMHSGEADSRGRDAASLDQQPVDLDGETVSPLRSPRDTQQLTIAACPTNAKELAQSSSQVASSEAAPSYSPRQGRALPHPTNYGERVTQDIYGRPVGNQLIVVLHETVASAMSTIRFFQTAHPNDADQASYHALVTRDGTIVYFVPPEKRAFGAGNSVFDGPNGSETTKTDPKLPPSVNNFAYHISLETPADGNHNRSSHSGYTEAQYQSLAWLVARTRVPDQRITTHEAVDRSGSRQDPRSFDSQKFLGILHSYPRPNVDVAQC